MTTSELTETFTTKVFGGIQKIYSHESKETNCKMVFGVFLPPQAAERKLPVIYWLAGLIANEQNFLIKTGAQKYAVKHGLILVAPDTSPRGCNIEGEEDTWEFGTSAGFYVDATTEKWKKNYRMYSYITKELPRIIKDNFPALPDKQSLMGHSMGGHGSLICYLKNPGQYKSVTAFAPIANPMNCPWGHRCFGGYLGDNREDWKAYDSCELIKKYKGPANIVVFQGRPDKWLDQGQLLPENLMAASAEAGVPVDMRDKDGYDHSYYFVSTFMEEAIEYHVSHLKSSGACNM